MHDHISIIVSLCSFSFAVSRTIFLICISLSLVVIRVIHWLHCFSIMLFFLVSRCFCGSWYYFFSIQYLIISWWFLCHPFTSVWFHFPRVFLCMSLFFHSVYHYLLMLSASSIHYSVLALCLSSACIVVFCGRSFLFLFHWVSQSSLDVIRVTYSLLCLSILSWCIMSIVLSFTLSLYCASCASLLVSFLL